MINGKRFLLITHCLSFVTRHLSLITFMLSSETRVRCPVCRAAVTNDSSFCASCGARLDDLCAQELRNVSYLLSELQSWETQGLIAAEKASTLRQRYESRRDELRAQLNANSNQAKNFAPPSTIATCAAAIEAAVRPTTERVAALRPQAQRAERRPLFETLTDPHTLRLLLYTGAAMLVVGVVIWLRDALYLKLQEPLVQAVLLACGTVAVTITGWLLTLRTRLRLTGRALTLTGSLLVPVNFWFLVRSGLISNNGRAWFVCALCAALYAYTAALLREKLYVYLATTASVATAWALVFRSTPEAYGLYALTLMTASLVFLHLSRLFPFSIRHEASAEDAQPNAAESVTDDEASTSSPRWTYELWGSPLVHVALVGGSVGPLLHMLLRLGFSPPANGGILCWRATDYDAGVAILLFMAGAYIVWFTARYIYTKRRAVLYTTAALALFWAEFLLLDGLQARGQTYLTTLSLTALAASLVARLLTDEAFARALHRAADIVNAMLLWTASVVALLIYLATDGGLAAWRPSVFGALAATALHGALRGWRERSKYGAGLASVAALVMAATLSDALRVAGVFPSVWPIAAGVICAAFLLRWTAGHWLAAKTEASEKAQHERMSPLERRSLVAVISFVADGTSLICALLWFLQTLNLMDEDGWSAVCVLLLALLYWVERVAHGRRALFVSFASAHAGAFLLALLVALRIEVRWFVLIFTATLFSLLFAISRRARVKDAGWLARPAGRAAATLTALTSLGIFCQAVPLLQTGNELLLAPSLAAGALCCVTLLASFFSTGRERVHYFRVALGAGVACYCLTILRAGFDPIKDVEMYTSPVAVLLLVVAYLALRREWDEYAPDTSLLLWTGSILLCGPVLIRALQFRLLLELPTPWRDLGVLGAALTLVLCGAVGRLRAPVVIGSLTLLLELAALTLTSVNWLQVPLRTYLITAGVTFLIVWGVFEYRREQLLLMRRRLQERSAQARERFGQWR